MKTYWVLWTYIANFSRLLPIDATTADDAAERATCIFGADFKARGNVYVFDAPPAFVKGQDVERLEHWREEHAARPNVLRPRFWERG